MKSQYPQNESYPLLKKGRDEPFFLWAIDNVSMNGMQAFVWGWLGFSNGSVKMAIALHESIRWIYSTPTKSAIQIDLTNDSGEARFINILITLNSLLLRNLYT